jgi:hypothetical protein
MIRQFDRHERANRSFASRPLSQAILFLFTRIIIAVWYQVSVPLNYFARPFALRFIKRNI